MRPAASSISGSWTAWRPDAKAGPRVLQLSLKKEGSLRNQCAWRRFRRVLFCLLRRSFGVDGGGPIKCFARHVYKTACSTRPGGQRRAERPFAVQSGLRTITLPRSAKRRQTRRPVTKESPEPAYRAVFCCAVRPAANAPPQFWEKPAAAAEERAPPDVLQPVVDAAGHCCSRQTSQPTHRIIKKSPARQIPHRAFCAAYSARSWPGQRSPHKGAGALPQALKNGITRTAWPASAGTRNDPSPCRRPRRTALQHARGKPASGGCNGSRW